MAARAVAIGSEIEGLSGVGRDLDIVSELLVGRGFEVRRHEKGKATRDAIGEALRDLTADTQPGDAVAVYYSGHGGRTLDTSGASAGGPGALQFIAPYDFTETTSDDFRGITALELSVHLAALSARTRNVTVLLDCCYSSRMARDVDLVPKAITRTTYVDVAAHLARVGVDRLARGLDRNVDSNPGTVRLVAAGPAQQAFEYPGPGGGHVGLFTEALGRLLAAAGDAPLTWAAVARAVREWVQVLAPNQRPEAEGPADRLLFSTDVQDHSGLLTVAADRDGVVLGGGRLAGVGSGDVYAAVGPADRGNTAALLTVRSVTAVSATADVAYAPGVAALPAGVEAHPLRRAGRRMAVVVDGDGVDADAVRAALAASVHVEPVVAGGVADDVPVLASVHVAAAGADISDAAGPITGWMATDDDGMGMLVRNLDRLARAAAVRALDPGDVALGEAVDVVWGRVEDGVLTDLPETGATLFEGDRVWVRIRNTGPTRVFVFVFGIGGSGRIGLITNADPSGIALDRDEEWMVGRRWETGVTAGLPVSWPTGIARSGPRPESVLILATSQRQELRVLEQEGVARGRPDGATPLEELLGQIAVGGSRDITDDEDTAVQHAVRHVDYLLVPAARPSTGIAAFRLDDRPDLSMSLLAPRMLVGGPARVAVHLAELAVRGAGAPGAGPSRLDVLVVTGPEPGGAGPVCAAGTWRGGRAQGDEHVVFGDLELFRGRVVGYLDIAVWVSPDRTQAPDLADLIATAGTGRAVPSATVAAVAAVVDSAAEALDAALGLVVGAYRASFLAGEDFGVGERMAGGLRTGPGVRVRYRVEAV